MSQFTFSGKDFYLDGQPFRVLSGAVHYFRVPREYWADRLLKLKECGFNTVETYVCWNLHEPMEGKFNFEGMLDLCAFIDIAADLGLYVILRPGPYICAEWEGGGLPAWLLTDEKMQIRCYEERYLSKVRNFFYELFSRVLPKLCTRGGNIIMVQIENEYGSYGNDKDYLGAIVEIYRECKVDCLLFTADGTRHSMLTGGLVDGYMGASNFGNNASVRFEKMSAMRPEQPDFCGEYWCGWFDTWGNPRPLPNLAEKLATFKEMLDYSASVNVYMFHGGTNFGFTGGANFDGKYMPATTSYDYRAPLSEAGDRTGLYYEMRNLISERFGYPGDMTARETPKKAYGKVSLTEIAELLPQAEKLGGEVKSASPLWSEELGQNMGYTLYSSEIRGGIHGMPLIIDEVRDRASVYIDGEHAQTFSRFAKHEEIPYDIADDKAVRIDILSENLGRINYGPAMFDRKGIKGVRFGNRLHFGWTMIPLPMEDLSGLEYTPFSGKSAVPAFLRGELVCDDEPADTFVRLDGFHNGFVVVNGNNTGVYRNDLGPQKTLYVPAPFLKKGKNEIIVFESDKTDCEYIIFTDKPDLG